MKITFLGAVEEVTGSRHLLEDQDTKILVDCGLFQGDRQLTQRNREKFPITPSTIDAIILTHAHIDHTGYIPVLIKNGFKGKIYCSRATYELCEILLLDSGALQEDEAKHSKTTTLPLYTKQDAKKSLSYFNPIEYDKTFNIKSLHITLIKSEHILGSSFVVVNNDKQTISFSGDLGRPKQFIQNGPPYLKQTDFLVLESTYGDNLHEPGDPIKELGDIVNESARKGGMLIIPCFVVERTQTILYLLYQLQQKGLIPKLPIYLDSPMAINVNNIFCKYPNEHKLSVALCQEALSIATYTPLKAESKELDNITDSAIIIAGSGMADGGRVMYHLQRFISNNKNTVAFVGFQAKGTKGRLLVDGAKEIRIYGNSYPVHATIKTIQNLSSHADFNEILEWLSHFEKAPKEVFLTHGEIASSQALKQKIEAHFGWQVVLPKYLESFDLNL